MENYVDIYNLLPSEIKEAIQKLQGALLVVEGKKNTNSRVADNIKNTRKCPNCSSQTIVKNGHDKNKVQCYKCKDCNKKFSASNSTLVYRVKFTYNKLVIFFECMNNKMSIRKTAALMDVNKNTVFLLRHKVLDCIAEYREKMKLKGTTEADECYKSINLKGTPTCKMPRFSKPRSSAGGSKRGISNHQVCIASAIDEYDNFFLKIVGTGPITCDNVEKAFKEKIDDVSLFITDCKSSYEKFIQERSIKLEQIKSGTYVNENGFSLANINSLHSELSTFLSVFKGVSTKHLQHYLDWFSFQKIINYTVDVIKQSNAMMDKAISKECSVNSSNVYGNESGIDFKKVYSDFSTLSPTI